MNDSLSSASILSSVRDYYSGRIREFGPTPRGVDWNSSESQINRFNQLLKLLPENTSCITLGDFGCGYGGLIDRLTETGFQGNYKGYDISLDQINAAKARYAEIANMQFSDGESILKGCDYIVASGIFNVKKEIPIEAWKNYMFETLNILNRYAVRGFAFNVLTSYSDKHRMREDLYYADPLECFEYCRTHFARNIALLHDYGLYEFTMIVRKD